MQAKPTIACAFIRILLQEARISHASLALVTETHIN